MTDISTEKIKKLGFGLMRLPMKDGGIDMDQTKEMVDLFMQSGCTYFDTAYVYGDGQSERAAGEALVKRYPRESFQLATKLPLWDGVKERDELRRMFDISLERTGAGYFDFYLLHNLGGGRTEVFEKSGAWEFVSEMKEKGLVRHMGFSFHDTADKLDAILNAHPEAEFVQLQINYADWEDESIQSRKCYETARRHGKKIIIMEPVRGGCLATLPDSVSAIFREAEPESSVASWAIRFAASLDGVITVLSGMSDISQVRDNVSVIDSFRPLDGRELAVIERVRQAMSEIGQIPCTSCGYCEKGCPKKIPIPKIFASLNYQDLYNNYRSSLGRYNRATESSGRASDCISCLKCEGVCPQHIKITDNLRRAAEVFEK